MRDASASANPSTACPATIFVTLSAQHGVRSRSWWNCIAMDASNPPLKKHTEVFSTRVEVAVVVVASVERDVVEAVGEEIHAAPRGREFCTSTEPDAVVRRLRRSPRRR